MKRSILPTLAGLFFFPLLLLADTWEERNADRHVLNLSIERDIQIFPDFTRKTSVRSLHKVQSPEAIKNGFGEFQEEYNPTFDKLTMSAVVITPDGKRIRHNKVQDKARSGDNAVYDDTRVVTLTLPHLTVGSTVELRIAYHNFKPRVPGQFELFHQIEPSAEAKQVRYAVTWPKGMDLTFLPSNGLASGKATVTNGKHTLEWNFQDRDEIPDETHMPPLEHLGGSLAISNWKDWSQLDAFFAPLVEGSAKVTPPIQKLAEEIMAKSTSTADRIQEVFNYIDDNVRYVSMNLGQNGLTPHPADETLKNRYGDCKDRTALAIAILKVLGVQAYPTLVAPALPEIQDTLPSWGHFNHMIAAVEYDGLHFVESTDNNFPYMEQHPGLNGAQVFLINGHGGKRITLPTEDITRPGYWTTTRIQLNPDGSGRLNQTGGISRKSCPMFRQGIRAIESMPKPLADKSKQIMLAGVHAGIQDGAIEFQGVDQRFGRIQTHITGTATDFAQKNGPFLVYALELEDRMRSFPDSPRVHPLWFTVIDYAHTETVVQLPAGHSVVHRPRNFDMKTDGIRFKRACKLEGNRFTVIEDRWLTPARLPATEYHRLRQFHQELKNASEDNLILRKTSAKEARKP
jgi:transglutaminase-like putative cysteine protease